MTLDDQDRAMLDFEREWPTMAGADKSAAITERFDMPVPNYFLALIELINDPEALAYDEVTVRRLRNDANRSTPAGDQVADVVPFPRRGA